MKITQQELKQIILEEVQCALKEAEEESEEAKERDPCEKKCTEEVINKKGADWKDHPKMVKARSDCMKKCKG
jgi:hypothetical protein